MDPQVRSMRDTAGGGGGIGDLGLAGLVESAHLRLRRPLTVEGARKGKGLKAKGRGKAKYEGKGKARADAENLLAVASGTHQATSDSADKAPTSGPCI